MVLTIRLLQQVNQFLLCDGLCIQLSDLKEKRPHVIGCNLDQHLNLLTFSVGLGDNAIGVLPWVNVQLVLLVVRVPANSALPSVGFSLYIKSPTVKLVIRVVGGVGKAVPPG